MATNLTTLAGGRLGASGDGLIPAFWADSLRQALYPSMFWRQLGTLAPIPRWNGDKIKLPRYTPVIVSAGGFAIRSAISTISSFSVTEGTSIGNFEALSAGAITAVPVATIGMRKYSDKLVMINPADFEAAAIESLTRELAYVLDKKTRAAVSASARTLNIDGGAFTSKFKLAQGVKSVFLGRNMARITTIMDASNNQRWDDGSYVTMAHPFVQFDVFTDLSANTAGSVASFTDSTKYGRPEDIYRGEIGKLFGSRLILTNTLLRRIGAAGQSATDGISPNTSAFQSYTFAPDAFYTVELEDGGLQVIHHELGSGGSTGDPANQIGSIAVKIYYVAVANADATAGTGFGGNNRLMRINHNCTISSI